MLADSHQASTLEVSRRARSVWFGLTTGWLIVGLAVASLLVGLLWSYSSVRYPGAERQALGSLSQQNTYQTSDDLPKVLRWYTRHFGLGHDMPQANDCVTMTQVQTHLFLQQSLAVTLCAQPRRTLIFVNRLLALR